MTVRQHLGASVQGFSTVLVTVQQHIGTSATASKFWQQNWPVVGGTPPAAPIGCCGANMTPTCTLEAVWEEEEEEEDTYTARTRTGMEMGCPFLVAAREGVLLKYACDSMAWHEARPIHS